MMREDTYFLLRDVGYPNIDKRDIEDASKWIENNLGLVPYFEKLFNGKCRPMIYNASDHSIILSSNVEFECPKEAFESAIGDACNIYLTS